MTSGDFGYFNQIAETWARAASLDPAARDAALDAARIPAGGCVLDAGCGSGLLLPALLERVGPDGRVAAVDGARRMLAIAARRHTDPRIRFIHAALMEYDVADGPFDAIVCCRSLHHLPDPAVAAARMAGWLRPGGRLVVLHESDANGITDAKTALSLRLSLERGGLVVETVPAPAGWQIVAGTLPTSR